MKKLNISNKTKQIISVIFLVIMVGFIVFIFGYIDKLTNYASQLVKSQSSFTNTESMAQKVDSAFNYRQNGLAYKLTFLEFGATGCTACKRMETVMNEIRSEYPDKVNVIFLNILLPENQDLMKYYGIVSIPTQVLLNQNGKEFFRHAGYFSTEELIEVIQTKL